MADITDSLITKFVNEGVRPTNERIRSVMQYQLDEVIRKWDADIEPALSGAADDDVIADGRDSEGVPHRTVGELRGWVQNVRLARDVLAMQGSQDRNDAVGTLNTYTDAVDVPQSLFMFTVRLNLFG